MPGFFSKEKLESMLGAHCHKCNLYRKCKNPKMPVYGKGKEKILLIAESSTSHEDEYNDQMIGGPANYLRSVLDDFGLDLEEDCWKTNAIICCPGTGRPTRKQIEYCRPNVWNTIEKLDPVTIILLGGAALSSVVEKLWGENINSMGKWVGWQIPSRRTNAWICPTHHPAYILSQDNPVLELWFKKHLENAIAKSSRPWKSVPIYSRHVKIQLDPGMIDDFVSVWTDEYPNEPIAFDYETTCLKPDGPEAEIVSASIGWQAANEVRGIGFPWQGEAIPAMKKLLTSKVPKIAHNIKFEERWTMKEFGHGVRNWKCCTMQDAHILDNRPGITSLNFQAFVQLGQEPYDRHIKPFLQSTGPGKPNRIKEIPMDELLMYGGLDALLTYHLAEKQMKDMGI